MNQSPQEPPIVLLFLEHDAPNFRPQIMMSHVHDIIWYHCKGFLMFDSPSGGSTIPHVQQRKWRNVYGKQLRDDGALEFSTIKTCFNFRRSSSGVLISLCKII